MPSHTLKLVTSPPSVEADGACRQTARRRSKRAPEQLAGAAVLRDFLARRCGWRAEIARAWDVDGTVVDNVSRGWAPLTEARVDALPPLVRRAVERAMDKCFDETIKEAA